MQDENLNIEDKIDLLYKYVENNIEQEQSEDIAITKFSNIEEHLNMLDRLRKHEDLLRFLLHHLRNLIRMISILQRKLRTTA